MKKKSRAARFKVGPRAPSSRESPPSRQIDFSSHEPPHRTPSDPPQPLERPFGPRKDWHANRDELRSGHRRARKLRKSERAKIESFVLCSTFLVPRNTKQRRGNCHNPIFAHEIFSGVDTQNKIALTKPACSDEGSPRQTTPKRRPGAHFPEFDQV